jgi:3-methyladenine DNA glycosylase AlkD
MDSRLIAAVRRELKKRADPTKARGARAYMKSAMPFRGVPAPVQESIWRDVFPRYRLSSFDEWRETVLALWRDARYREERYGAIALSGWKGYSDFQTLRALPIYEEIVVDGAWWDFVDAVAIHRIGPLVRKYPSRMKKTMLRWSRARNMWKRRTAILCQITFKADTDLNLLYGCIEPNLRDREFFIRKAIGWALRQLAWTNPAEVTRYVREHEAQLSPLSRKEALKNVGRMGRLRRGAAAP